MKYKKNLIKANSIFRTIALLLFLSTLLACNGKESSAKSEGSVNDPRKKRVAPVTVAVSVKKTIPLQISCVGNVRAFQSLSVVAQVSGELLDVHIKDGQKIKEGMPLFTIDPAPFKAKLNQAEAILSKDLAMLENAKKQMNRSSSLANKGYVAQEQYDKSITDVAVIEASIKSDKANIENTKIDLEYCFIKSKINGIAGDIKIDKGNIIKANGNEPLVVINQIEPINVAFSIPEKRLPEIREYMASGKLKVTAFMPGTKIKPEDGELTFLDNAVDTMTGMILLKAVFENKNHNLWPGQFVQVILTLTNQPDVVTIPSQAVQTGQQGQYVYIVNQDQTVSYRLVTVERIINDDVIISKGIDAGEKVVTDGQIKLTNGSLVKIIEGTKKS